MAKKTKKKKEIAAPKTVKSNESIIKNGTVINRGAMSVQPFSKNTRFFLQNETYNGEYSVVEERKDGGSDFRHFSGGQDDVIVQLGYLQSQYAIGNLKLLDEDGNVI